MLEGNSSKFDKLASAARFSGPDEIAAWIKAEDLHLSQRSRGETWNLFTAFVSLPLFGKRGTLRTLFLNVPRF